MMRDAFSYIVPEWSALQWCFVADMETVEEQMTNLAPEASAAQTDIAEFQNVLQ